jgi:aryl-alcohol dehydrogenase-like predicted oxidoreductase
VTFLDTSDIYGPFKNEELVGESYGCMSSCTELSEVQ